MNRIFLRVAALACAAGALAACPSPTTAGAPCSNSKQCDGARCVFVANGDGHCEGGTIPAPAPADAGVSTTGGEGEGAPAGEGEGAPAGEGEGAPAGEGEGEGAVDLTPHFARGAFTGGAARSSSPHFVLTGSVGPTLRR